jgi:hypothetical protein
MITLEAAQDALARGDRAEARRILDMILMQDADNEAALELLLQTAVDDDDQRMILKRLLRVNPRNEQALRAATHGAFGAQDVQNMQNAMNVVGGLLGGALGRGIMGGNNPFRDALNQLGGPTFMAGAQGQLAPEPQKTYEMLWDCKFCGTTKLLGKTHRFCPNCGAAQDPASRYFPSDEEKVAVEDHIFVGKDLICGSCGTLNAGDTHFCQNCGAPMESAQRASTLDNRSAGAGQTFGNSGSRDIALETFNEEQARIAADERARRAKQRRPYIIAGVAVAVVAVIAVIFLLFRTWNAEFMVVGHRWERTIRIQEYAAVREGSWDEAVPISSYNRTCYDRQRGSRQVDTGQQRCTNVQVDNGDGTFSQRQQCSPIYRDEPVYDTWCDYTIERWADVQPAVAQGSSIGDAPRWPTINLNTCSGSPRLGCERESRREEAYVVVFSEGNSTQSAAECTFDNEQMWRRFEPNSLWNGSKRALGGLLCETLEQG